MTHTRRSFISIAAAAAASAAGANQLRAGVPLASAPSPELLVWRRARAVYVAAWVAQDNARAEWLLANPDLAQDFQLETEAARTSAYLNDLKVAAAWVAIERAEPDLDAAVSAVLTRPVCGNGDLAELFEMLLEEHWAILNEIRGSREFDAVWKAIAKLAAQEEGRGGNGH